MSSGFFPPTDVPSMTTEPFAAIIPLTARIVVVLPAPLAPRMTTASPASTEKRHAPQDLDRAVARLEVLDLEQRGHELPPPR